MKALLQRPLPVLLVIAVALALAIGHAAGSDPESEQGPVAEPVAREPAARRDMRAVEVAVRAARAEVPDAPVADLFDGRSWLPAPPVAAPMPASPPPPPPAPRAPAVPYAFVGRLDAEGARPIVYLSHGERLLEVRAGEVFDENYRLESLGDEEIVLTFLPLGERQVLRLAR